MIIAMSLSRRLGKALHSNGWYSCGRVGPCLSPKHVGFLTNRMLAPWKPSGFRTESYR